MKKQSTPAFRLDEQVYLTLGALALLSLIILAFRYATQRPCAPITISVQAASMDKGSLIGFKAETVSGKNYQWDFGDGQNEEETNPSVQHKYINAGKYTIAVTVDGECTEFQDVVITEPPISNAVSLQPMFTGPDTAYVNQPATYEDISTHSTNWEWHFEEANKIDAVTRMATHVYTTPGVKKVTLMVNGRRDLITYRFVYVIDRDAQRNLAKAKSQSRPIVPKVIVPEKPTVAPLVNPTNTTQATVPEVKKEEEKPKPKAPDVSDQQIESMLREVIAGTKTAQDFAPYLCNNLALTIVYNSNNMAFNVMCEDLKGLKKKKIKKLSVKLLKNPDNCVGSMIVVVDAKSKILGL